MGDQLERFIMEQRDQFDTDMPSDRVWQGIQQKSKKRSWVGVWKVAAVILLISTSYLIIEKKLVINEQESVSMASEFEQVEQYYTQLIAQKKSQITQSGESELSREFLIEIERLDQTYDQLKQTYVNQNSTEHITDMMIENLRLRIEILNKQVEILNGIKNQENEKDRSISI